MHTGYILECLDTLITVTLNPIKWKTVDVVHSDIAVLQSLVVKEKDKIQAAIKSTIFNLNNELKIRSTIRKYHWSLVSLLDQALKNQKHYPKTPQLIKVSDTIIVCIEELLSLIERRFTIYISKNERVPATYLQRAKKEVAKKLDTLSKKNNVGQSDPQAFSIMRQGLEIFLNFMPDNHFYSFREIFYIKNLCRELESLEIREEGEVYSVLDELLIRMNFNSHAYTKHLIEKLEVQISSLENTSEKIERLLFYRKKFNQFHRKPSIKFLVSDLDLDKGVDNWFLQEIFYLENQGHYPVASPKSNLRIQKDINKKEQKITSILSVDQMALILRAADEMKIILARSLNAVFKSIVPYLSTTNQENISYDSMRSKSYSAETRDKEMVIKTLHEMIKIIKEY
ncbi:MAG: hypothetical protein ABI237_14830 [Ginsengibacter sp.]